MADWGNALRELNHFSLLRMLEASCDPPCLNHA